MLEKIITSHEFDVPEVNVIRPSEAFGVKCASRNMGMCHNGPCSVKQANDSLKEFIRTLKVDPRYLYLHIIALGAGETFGANSNGDFFPEEGLLRKHNTFCTHAKHYKYHINKDQRISYGHPVFSTYNHPMHRVELILAVDKQKAPDLVQSAERGEHLSYSMSCRIPYDCCSICGNKARVKRDYCNHIKNQLLKIMPDGRQAYMINPDPTFFDISYVLRPADKTARMISKVASCPSSSKSKIQKPGSIKKEIDVILIPLLPKEQQERFVKDAMPMLIEMEPELPIDRLKEYSFKDILSTLTLSGVLCRPHELGRIIVVKKAKDPQSEIQNLKLSDHFNDDLYSKIRDIISHRSFYCPHIISRMQKMAGGEYVVRGGQNREEKPIVTGKQLLAGTALAGGGYAAYKTEIGRNLLKNIAEMIEKRPGKFLLLAGLGTLALKTAPILGKGQVSDSLVVYHDMPRKLTGDGMVIEGFKAAACRPSVKEVIKQSMQPFSRLFIENYKEIEVFKN